MGVVIPVWQQMGICEEKTDLAIYEQFQYQDGGGSIWKNQMCLFICKPLLGLLGHCLWRCMSSPRGCGCGQRANRLWWPPWKEGMSQQPSIQNATPKDLQGYKWRFRHITQGEDESGLERLHQCADNELQVCLNDKEFQ
ncbi:uncharacterized protein [Malus domestica]|uniref:uncharacterized protein n=1 Tax=Malus domestica TaxID=3750 RepID=UPI0039750E54